MMHNKILAGVAERLENAEKEIEKLWKEMIEYAIKID